MNKSKIHSVHNDQISRKRAFVLNGSFRSKVYIAVNHRFRVEQNDQVRWKGNQWLIIDSFFYLIMRKKRDKNRQLRL